MRFPGFVPFLVCITLNTFSLFAQSPNGNINGLVSDPSSAAVVGAEVVAVNDVTGVQYTTKTNNEGIYVLPNLPPGPYRVQVSKIGFKTLIKPDISLNVQDSLSINFALLVGAFHEIITVQGGAPLVDTESATVSTVVDRQFAENLPMNGRSFQTLIELTPGVVPTVSNSGDSGQFSVNGQRAASNYWMVDGVSANIGIGATQTGGGNGLGGTLGSFSALGGTNSLVSVDAMQEFRIQTSTFAPEFGRTPGAQISIVTRSGANLFHGTVFDYLRNDFFDASDWFNGYTNVPPLPKAKERQNDFGATFSGPIVHNRAFFFFSYEGLRLRLPETSLTTVPDLAARQNAVPAMRPYLDVFPMPNGPDDSATGMAQFNASFSNPASLDACSLRLDYRLSDKWSLFARYNYSPSQLQGRGGAGTSALNVISTSRITTQTGTAGATWDISPRMTGELRFNYSVTNSLNRFGLDGFGGAIPLASIPFPDGINGQDGLFSFSIFSLTSGFNVGVGALAHAIQNQINFTNGFTFQRNSHTLKFGVDYRRLSPQLRPRQYQQVVSFNAMTAAESGQTADGDVFAFADAGLIFHNLGVYAQDSWHTTPRLSLTYGMRWDVDFSPSSSNGPSIPSVTGYNLVDFSQLAIARVGTPPFRTTYDNLAPRFGLAYQLHQNHERQSILRGGVGIFYDLASSEVGNLLGTDFPPFGARMFLNNVAFPYSPSETAEPLIPSTASLADVQAFNPHLKLPYTLEWNLALEQSLGKSQTISAIYIGAAGRRLLLTSFFSAPPSNPNIASANLVDNLATSNYQALQIQFRRPLSAGLQALASYSWSHSIDDGSAASGFVASDTGIPGSLAENRASSDFDVRHAVTAGLTYNIPAMGHGFLPKAIVSGWSTENFAFVHTAPPVDLTDVNFFEFNNGSYANVRPDLVPGQPFYLYGSQYPGRKALNRAAFANPPMDTATGNPLRQGTLGRNALRGFGVAQWDCAIHRDFPVWESARLQFRTEFFNLLNHPNFGPPNNNFGAGGFGLATQVLAQSLNRNNLGGGAFDPLYQIGGPRSIQLALKLVF